MDHKWLETSSPWRVGATITRAAEQRHVTQPQFSRRIRANSGSGADLVNRAGMPLALTAAVEVVARGTQRAVVNQPTRVHPPSGAGSRLPGRRAHASTAVPGGWHKAHRAGDFQLRLLTGSIAEGATLLEPAPTFCSFTHPPACR